MSVLPVQFLTGFWGSLGRVSEVVDFMLVATAAMRRLVRSRVPSLALGSSLRVGIDLRPWLRGRSLAGASGVSDGVLSVSEVGSSGSVVSMRVRADRAGRGAVSAVCDAGGERAVFWFDAEVM